MSGHWEAELARETLERERAAWALERQELRAAVAEAHRRAAEEAECLKAEAARWQRAYNRLCGLDGYVG